MELKPFLLDKWLDTYERSIEFNLASSTGPSWTLKEILSLSSDEEREIFLNHKLVYGRPAGAESLRAAIADMQQVDVDHVQVVTGASEALLVLMWLAAEPGANVILPQPGFATFSALPESLRLETRYYPVRKENGFAIDVEEIQETHGSKYQADSDQQSSQSYRRRHERCGTGHFARAHHIAGNSTHQRRGLPSYLSWTANKIGCAFAPRHSHP
jgi:aminotransferase class I and II